MSMSRGSLTTNSGAIMVTTYIPWVIRGTALVMALFAIPLDIITRTGFEDREVDIISSLQDNRSSNLDDFFRGIIFLGSHNIIIFVLPAIYNIVDPVITMKITIVTTHVLYIYSFFALALTEPRPYWIHSQIRGINCEDGFGSPAEEVLFSMVFILYLMVEFAEGKIHTAYLAILYILSSIWILSISFAEVFLGENFIHQILLTLCIGYVYFTIALMLGIYLSQLALISSYYTDKNRKAKIWWFIAAMAMSFSVLCLHMNIEKNSNIPILWIKNSYKHCKFSSDVSGFYSFYQCAWVFYNLGAVYGAQFTSKTLPESWWRTGKIKKLLRMGISGGVGYGIYYGFNSINTYDAHTKFAFHYCINLFICAIVCYGALPVLFQKIRLTCSEDVDPVRSMSGISLHTIND